MYIHVWNDNTIYQDEVDSVHADGNTDNDGGDDNENNTAADDDNDNTNHDDEDITHSIDNTSCYYYLKYLAVTPLFNVKLFKCFVNHFTVILLNLYMLAYLLNFYTILSFNCFWLTCTR